MHNVNEQCKSSVKAWSIRNTKYISKKKKRGKKLKMILTGD